MITREEVLGAQFELSDGQALNFINLSIVGLGRGRAVKLESQ